MTQDKEIILGALDCFCPSFLAQGLWTHQDDRSLDFHRLSYWTDYARLLERGLFDMIFLADTIGVYDVYGGSKDAAVRAGVQVPMNDPFALIGAMASVTEHLGFAVTGNVLYETPYLFARRLSTLDHLTGGRIGWNIVTGILESGARAQGREMPAHDARYDYGDDFMEIVYRLWEQSWEPEAVTRDRASRVYADPARVHEVSYQGAHLSMSGMHLCEPSPQRTPVLFQAGSSGRGKLFAARHAECMFVNGTTRAGLAAAVADIRRAMREQGRSSHRARILAGLTVIVGRTADEAREKHEEYRRAASAEATLVHASGGLGVDLSRYPLDGEIEYSETDANRTLMENLTRRGGRAYSVREVAEQMSLSGRNLLIVGDVEHVVDEMAGWMRDTDIDGFNLARLLMPRSFEDFIDLVVPRLQERGLYKTAYRPGTLREKLALGDGARLAGSHSGRVDLAAAA